GINDRRIPCPSSIKSKPSSLLISLSIASPAVWRPEFQQVENAITLNSSGDRRRRFDLVCFCDCRLGALPAHAPQNNQRDQSVATGRDCQCCAHSDEIR